MEKLMSDPIPNLVGLLLLIMIYAALLDIKRILARIDGRLEEANEADPHVTHQRYLRANDIR